MKGYYFITDAALSLAGNLSDVKSAVSARVEVVQYRDKRKTTPELLREASALREICKHTTFLINDRVDIALAIEADGVHLGQDDLPYPLARKLLGKRKIIGLTVHNLEQAALAQTLGADYIAVSPIFATTTKPDAGRPVGIALLEEIRKRVRLPIVAVGGINLKNLSSVVAAGADAVSAISDVVTKSDVTCQILNFQKFFQQSQE
jgi:thiamine-phosphate pyrophosphorylase